MSDARVPEDHLPSVSVVIPAFADERFDVLMDGVAAVAGQRPPAVQTIVVVDHNEALLARVADAVPEGVVVIPNDGPAGAAGARNTGIARAIGEIVAFLDDDARPLPGWIGALARAHRDPQVVGTGGWIEPRWLDAEPAGFPAWYPAEFRWVVSCSYVGLPGAGEPIRNPIGANMSFRRDALEELGGFPAAGSRIGAARYGYEETELAVRAQAARPGSVVLHVPEARAEHVVPPERLGFRHFVAYCFGEGIAKAMMTGAVGTRSLRTELAYTLRVLPRGILRGLGDALRGDPAGLARAGAIIAGLAATAAGYVRGRVTRALS